MTPQVCATAILIEDKTRLDLDAIAANPSLLGGGGVDARVDQGQAAQSESEIVPHRSLDADRMRNDMNEEIPSLFSIKDDKS